MEFRFTPMAIPDVLVVDFGRVGDERGFFSELFRAEAFVAQGIAPFVQDNLSRSRQGVLRGMHYQLEPAALGKLVRCARGRIFDVAVDIRFGSPSYARWVAVELEEDQPRALYVPPGFAHGFCALSEIADVSYRMTSYYSPAHERAFRWDDPTVGIRWPVDAPLLSAKDAVAPPLGEAENNFRYAQR